MTDAQAEPGSGHARERARADAGARSRVWLAILLLAFSALLPFAPSPAGVLRPPAPDAALWARLFPDVSTAWLISRLGALGLALLLLAPALPRTLPGWPPLPTRDEGTRRSSSLWAALAVALLLLALAPFVSHLSRGGQGLFVLGGFAPALLLAWMGRGGPSPSDTQERRAPWWLVSVLVGIWIVLRIPRAWHAPGVADSIDTWLNFGWLASTLEDGSNLLTTGPQPGVTNLHLVFLGAPLLGPDRIPLSLGWIQAMQTVYIGASALLLADIVAWLAGRGAALVATTAFLFSPFVLALPYVPTVFSVVCALMLWLLWAVLCLHRSASPAALACLGALGGVSTTIPQMVPFALIAGVATLVFFVRGPRLPWTAWAAATASFLALALPGMPTPATLQAMRDAYLALCAQWAGLEAVLLGQRSPYDVPPVWELWMAGRPGFLDIPLGTLLAPIATPRTALRLWADVYLEPFSIGLYAVGLLQCVLAARRDRRAILLLAVLAAAVLPGFTSAYDRASLTRALGLPLVAAMLIGLGFEELRRVALPRSREAVVSGLAVLLVAGSGLVLFDIVTPRILARSSLGVMLRVLGAGPDAGRAVALGYSEHDGFDWLHVERIARYAPAKPMPSRPYEGSESLTQREGGGRPDAALFFYSPALEQDRSVSRDVCARWPGAALYAFTDDAGLSRVLAARPTGADWKPAWPHATQRRCSDL